MKSYKFNLISAAIAMLTCSMAEADVAAATPEEAKKSKTVYVPVTMKSPNADGTPRVVQFPEKTKVKKEVLVDAEGKSIGVRFDFSNGDTESVMNSDIEAAGLTSRFVAHGISQKFGDSYASAENVDDCYESFKEVHIQILAGKWSEGGGGTGGGGSSVLLKALVEATGQTIDAVRATLATLSQKEKLVLRGEPTLQPIIQRLEAEKAGGVDRGAVAAKFGLKAA